MVSVWCPASTDDSLAMNANAAKEWLNYQSKRANDHDGELHHQRVSMYVCMLSVRVNNKKAVNLCISESYSDVYNKRTEKVSLKGKWRKLKEVKRPIKQKNVDFFM